MESESSEEIATSGIPRGGPIYLPDMVGELSTIPEFQSSFLNLLQDLDTHLSLESPSSSQQFDVSTDTLKIYTEEELADMAMKEAFQEDNLSQIELEQSLAVSHPENQSDGNERMAKRRRTVKKTSEAKSTVKKAVVKKTVKKTEDAFIAKLEQIVKLKQKQEDKSDVRLHCFSETCDNGEDVSTPPERFEKMQSLKSIDNYTLVKPSDIQGPVDMLHPEVILCIEVYNSRKLKTQEFLVLGSQMLTVLKDKIHCLTDQVMEKSGKYDPSGYFLIEDIFYNDLRSPSAMDYSKPVLNWLWNSKDEARKRWEGIITGESRQKQKAVVLGEAKAMALPRFGSADMHSTRFNDLRFRVGASYRYCHQGDCNHMIVIRDMRLSHPEDVQNRAAYPRLMFQLKVRVQKCNICKIYRATKVTMDDKWAKENHCYFCDACFALIHLESSSLKFDLPVFDYVYE